MTDVKLVINGQNFPLYYRMLQIIADNLPEEESYAPLAEALLSLGYPSITRKIINKDLLGSEDMDAIWDKGDIDLRRELTDTSSFLKNLTDAQAQEIINLNDPEILGNIAMEAELLYPDDEDENQARRLSGKMADALMEFISRHPESEVKGKFWENSSAPAKFKPPLAEMIKNRDLSWRLDVSAMTMEDIEALNNTSQGNLIAIANNVEDIKDKKVRAKVAELLCQYPDPEVRLELAENYSAPKNVLRKLSHDCDQDVARAASKRLEDDE